VKNDRLLPLLSESDLNKKTNLVIECSVSARKFYLRAKVAPENLLKVLFEVFLLNKVSFEWDTSMKDPCITREQSLGIHDVVNDQGFAMHYTCRAISNTVSHLEVFRCERINAAM